MYLISACLIGVNCRYDGKNNLDKMLLKLVNEGKAIPICPEVLGKLPIPRECCEIINKSKEDQKVISLTGMDKTEAFLKGARKTLELCKLLGINKAILKSRSPSCGSDVIYDGTFKGNLIPGKGLTAKLLESNGIEVYNEDNWKQLFNH